MITSTDVLKAKILVVDDLAPNVAVLERMLRGAGYTAVSSTQNPTRVFALHEQHHYDLILLDLNMPVMDGFAVMQQLKRLEVDGYLPVLVITADPHRSSARSTPARRTS